MNDSLNASPQTLREAFYALSTAKDVPDAEHLDNIVRRYPQFGEELTEFAIAIALDSLRGDRAVEAAEAALDPTVVSPGVSRAMSRFNNRLYAVTANASAQSTTTRWTQALGTNPFTALTRNDFRAVAERLNATTVFVGKLRDRHIDPRTMTAGFQRRVAGELRVPLDALVAHLEARPVAPTGRFFKADDKPSAGGQQTFEEALRTSGLSDVQQRTLSEL